MFKVKDKWKLDVLEGYGFKLGLYDKNTYYFFNGNVNYKVSVKTRRLELSKDIETYDFEVEVEYTCLSLFYKLIKDDIIEEIS